MWQQQGEITEVESEVGVCVSLRLISHLHFTCATVSDEILPMDMQPSQESVPRPYENFEFIRINDTSLL